MQKEEKFFNYKDFYRVRKEHNTQQQQNVEATIVGLISCLCPALCWNSKSEKEGSKNQKVLASQSGAVRLEQRPVTVSLHGACCQAGGQV